MIELRWSVLNLQGTPLPIDPGSWRLWLVEKPQPGLAMHHGIDPKAPVAWRELDKLEKLVELEYQGSDPGLSIGAMTSLDLALVAGHTELRRLDLLGDPQGGVAVRGLRKLVTLRRLAIGDAHHTEFADLPGSDRLPALKSLEIDGLREAAAAQIRARWAGFAGLALRGVRGDAWLAANADNPFRAWDEEHGAALGRRATNAWRKASGAIGARRPTRKRGERANGLETISVLSSHTPRSLVLCSRDIPCGVLPSRGGYAREVLVPAGLEAFDRCF